MKFFLAMTKSEPEFGVPVKMDLLNHERISNVLSEIKPRHSYSSWCNDCCRSYARYNKSLWHSKINSQATANSCTTECSILNHILSWFMSQQIMYLMEILGMYKENECY